jgi:hypothetical protein
MNIRMEDIELEEQGFEADFGAGREREEMEEVLRVGREINVRVEVEVEAEAMGNGGAEAEGAWMIADQGLEAEARGECEIVVGVDVEGEGEVGKGDNLANNEGSGCKGFLI